MANPEFSDNPFLKPPDRAEYTREMDKFRQSIEDNRARFAGIKNDPKYRGNLVIVDGGKEWTIPITSSPEEFRDFSRKIVAAGITSAAYRAIIPPV